MTNIREMKGGEIAKLINGAGYSYAAIARMSGLSCATVWAMTHGSDARESSADAVRRLYAKVVEDKRRELAELESRL